ncbi:ankyrin repeat-containing domain protein [Aspergillus cavernicola]|uniref:Ankyrin repeat-containing domain protein n=1 Tax=Aspergillus cavernicola TaxID=176166 RepID=A0ABR4HL60_9EURO
MSTINLPRRSLTQLPTEILLTIVEPLEITDLNSVLQTCRYLSKILHSRFYRLAVTFTFRQKYKLQSPLIWAAEHGRLSTVQKLLDAGAAVTTVLDGCSAFHYTVHNGHTEIARLLLDSGASPAQAGRNGEVPLVTAARGGHEHIVRLLLEVGSTERPLYQRALCEAVYAGHVPVVRLMLQGAVVKPGRSHPDSASDAGWLNLAKDESLIHEAARAGNCSMIRLLLDYGVRIPPVHRRANHPLVVAAQNGHKEAVQLLIAAGADSKNKNRQDEMAGHGESVHFLPRYSTDINQPTKDGRTPLQIALEEFNPPDVIHSLLDMGADTNIKGRGGSTALHTVIRLKRRDLLKFLLAADASLSIADDKGNTPLLLAVSVFNVDAVSLFLQSGAGTSERDNLGRTPLHIAATHESGVILAMLLNAGADVSATDDDGRIPLHFATLSDNPAIFKAILGRHEKSNIDHLVQSQSGRTVFEMAVEGGHLALVELLIQRGFAVTSHSEGYSALHAAVANKHLEIAVLLLDHGADPLLLDCYGRAPLDWAAADGEMLSRLLRCCDIAYMPTAPGTRLATLKKTVIRCATQILNKQTANIYKLAKCLVYLGDGDAARAVFTQAAKSRANEDDLRYPMACNICRKRLKDSGRSKFMVLICRRCHDLDLCNWGDGSPFLGFSSSAGFAVHQTPPVADEGSTHSWEQQLRQLIASYSRVPW